MRAREILWGVENCLREVRGSAVCGAEHKEDPQVPESAVQTFRGQRAPKGPFNLTGRE